MRSPAVLFSSVRSIPLLVKPGSRRPTGVSTVCGGHRGREFNHEREPSSPGARMRAMAGGRRPFDPVSTALMLAAPSSRRDRLAHLEVIDERPAQAAAWPAWAHPALVDAYLARGVVSLWSHQAEAAEAAWSGKHTVVATGTASGKSVAYLVPALTAIARSVEKPGARGDTVLYVSPTKALAHDQLDSVAGLAVPGVRAMAYDGDCTREERDWARN